MINTIIKASLRYIKVWEIPTTGDIQTPVSVRMPTSSDEERLL